MFSFPNEHWLAIVGINVKFYKRSLEFCLSSNDFVENFFSYFSSRAQKEYKIKSVIVTIWYFNIINYCKNWTRKNKWQNQNNHFLSNMIR